MAHDTSVGVVGVMREMTDSKTGGGVACQHPGGAGGSSPVRRAHQTGSRDGKG